MATNRWISTSDTSFTNTANWSQGSAPTTGDTIIFDGVGTASVLAGLNQSAVLNTTIYVKQGYSGNIGTGTSALQIGWTTLRIGDTDNGTLTANGPQRVQMDQGTNSGTAIVVQTNTQSADSGRAPVQLKGGGASNRLVVYSGIVDAATSAVGDTATFSEVDIVAQSNTQTKVYLASGCTLTTVNQLGTGSTLTTNSNVQNFNQSSGKCYHMAGTMGSSGTVQISGNLIYNSTDTLTTPQVLNGGTLDFSNNGQGCTVSSGIKAFSGATINFDNGNKNSITNTTGIQLQGCRLADIKVTTWAGNTVVMS